jgi:hypothetical protein
MTEPKELTYEAEVIEDARTGEEIPSGIQKVQSNVLATSLDLTKVGTTVLDDKAENVLSEPLKPEEVSIRPDGLVYLPWTWYADRLNRAFGRLAWGLVPQAGAQKVPMGNTELVVWGHWLVVRGVAVGFEYGECSYRPDNHTMSFGDAAAGAKSNSLARNCKMLGMSLELWNQEWILEWKNKYAERVKNPNGNRPEFIWRKKKPNTNGHKSTEQVVVKTSEAHDLDKVPVPNGVEPVKVEEVKATTEPVYEDLFTWADLKGKEKELASESGLSKAKVAVMLAGFDKTSSYSYQEVLKKLKGE